MAKPTKFSKQYRLRGIDMKVLEGLALVNPRNRTKLAVHLGMPVGTLRYRLNHLRSHFSLYLQGNLYHTNIGIRKTMVVAESRPGYEDLLYRSLKSNDYWLYVSQCLGSSKCVGTFGIPAGREKEFEVFIDKLKEYGVARDVSFFWSTCIHNVNTTQTWFDESSEEWVFPWESWLQEIPKCEGELPYTLIESGGYPQNADWIDVMILKELEKDCTVKLERIAKMLGLSGQRVKYHYDNHVIKSQMFEGPQILADHYRGLFPDTCLFIFSFGSYDNFKKFALSLVDKPFVRAMGKVYRKNRLFVRVYLPRQQLRNFVEALSKLVKGGFLVTYEYVIEDLEKMERQTISYEFFKNNKWEYDNGKYLAKLKTVAEKQMVVP